MEAWFPEAKAAGISDCWLMAKQVGNVYVISMDTQDLDIEFKRAQYDWVEKRLEEAKSLRALGQIDWIVVLAHKPFFTLKTSRSPYTAVRFLYKELFRDAQVDFVVHGRNHNTQIWYPMIPNKSEVNGEGEQLFKYAADGKTFDFSQDRGAMFIVSGRAGREWNEIDDGGAGVANVQHYRDSGKFGFTSIEFDGRKARVLSKDTDNATLFECPVARTEVITEQDPIAKLTAPKDVKGNSTVKLNASESKNYDELIFSQTVGQTVELNTISDTERQFKVSKRRFNIRIPGRSKERR